MHYKSITPLVLNMNRHVFLIALNLFRILFRKCVIITKNISNHISLFLTEIKSNQIILLCIGLEWTALTLEVIICARQPLWTPLEFFLIFFLPYPITLLYLTILFIYLFIIIIIY